jgi:hypothetical protein
MVYAMLGMISSGFFWGVGLAVGIVCGSLMFCAVIYAVYMIITAIFELRDRMARRGNDN